MGQYGDADLVVNRDVPYTRTLQYNNGTASVDWSLYNIKANARDRDGTLVFDLTPFFAVLSSDPTKLVLTIPAAFTYSLPREAKWDLLATLKTDATQTFRTPIPAGRLLLLDGPTHLV